MIQLMLQTLSVNKAKFETHCEAIKGYINSVLSSITNRRHNEVLTCHSLPLFHIINLKFYIVQSSFTVKFQLRLSSKINTVITFQHIILMK